MDFRVDFTSENILPDGSNFGYVGEHNAATLVITPPAEMTDNAEILYICLACEVGKEFIKTVVRSELYEKAAEIRIPLWAQATISESGKLQLEGYDGGENLLVKSELIDFVLSPSANGIQAATDMNGGSLAGTVAKNTAQIEELTRNGVKVKSKTFTNWEDCDITANLVNSSDVWLNIWDMTGLENAHIIDVGIILKLDGSEEFKEYNVSELIVNNLLNSSSSVHIIGKPTLYEDVAAYPVAVFGDITSAFTLLSATDSNVQGFTVYYLEGLNDET